jgi:mono/diheme cytochrome c family protein
MMRCLQPDGARRQAAAALVALAFCSGAGAAPDPAANPAPTRGQLLYDTHCIACHNAQIHWRDQRLASDWASLREQVRQWQARARLAWPEADIVEVTRHLNDTIYRLPTAGGQVGGLADAPGVAARRRVAAVTPG